MQRRDPRRADIPAALRLGRGLGRAREAELGAVLRDPGAPPAAKRAARDELAVANTALVLFAVGDYAGRGLELEDLVGAGNRGLLRAPAGYDPARGRFSGYAVTWIRQAMQQAVDDEAS